jgi:hypothetical protein
MSSSAEPRQTLQALQRGNLQDHVDLSTSQSTLPQTLPANIPAQASQVACEKLTMNICPEDDDSHIREFLDVVWITVHKALKQHPELREHLADEAEFLLTVMPSAKESKIFSTHSEPWQKVVNGLHYLKMVHCSLLWLPPL